MNGRQRPAAAAWLPAAILALCLGLAGCGGPAPQPVQPVSVPAGSADLAGPLRVHYNLLPTLAMGEAVAREYGVERSDGTALLVLALRRPTDAGDEVAAEGELTADVVDLSGRRQAVALRRVATGEYVDYIGTVRAGQHDTLRVEVSVVADGRRQEFDFRRNF